MNSTFSPSSRSALEHKKSLGQRKIGHYTHASTKGTGAFYAIANNAVLWKPAFMLKEEKRGAGFTNISPKSKLEEIFFNRYRRYL